MWFRNNLTVTFDAWSSARNRLAECEARLAAVQKASGDPALVESLAAESRMLRAVRDRLYQQAFEASRAASPRTQAARKTSRGMFPAK